jgi:1-acyl-sn-glycerol-3-phosphate acyltransferase
MLNRAMSSEVRERLELLDLPFNRWGMDPLGVSKKHLGLFYTFLEVMYRHYFRVRSVNIERVPDTGPVMLIANHSGGIPADAGMIMASLFLDHNPPRVTHGMVEKFAQSWPFVSPWFSRLGQLPGLPEHAVRILESGRVLLAFPEGARGTGKLFKDRYQLVRFGTGFMRIALQCGVPIVPIAFVGGEEALPTVYHSKTLAKIAGAPYWPVPPYLIPFPLPVHCEIHFGEPLRFEGTGDETDDVIDGHVATVRRSIEELIEAGREARAKNLVGGPA